jgi:hypothetical protein
MVGLSGLEPLTSPLSGVRSSQLSYRPPSAAWFRTRIRHGCITDRIVRARSALLQHTQPRTALPSVKVHAKALHMKN